MYIKQKYKYDCWVSALINLLKSKNIDFDYFLLMKELKTTWFWGTKPEKILELLENKDIKYDLLFDIKKPLLILVDQFKFYNEEENIDYWHYIYYTGNIKNNLLEIFDPRDWNIIYKSQKFILESTLEVLVWKKRRFSSFYISLS